VKTSAILLPTLALVLAGLPPAAAGIVITNVVETGGDNEPTDTILAQWTGQTFPISIAGEPFPGAVIGESFTVGSFASGAPAYVDRNHRYLNDLTSANSFPGYLIGGDYIMSGNDNRDNAGYQLDITVNQPARAYMLIDNRLPDGVNTTPPQFGPTAMQWMLDQGWLASANGINRTANPAVPDEVAFDEGANDTIDQWMSIYYKDFNTGTFTILQADNAGRNMYGVVVQPIPEPATAAMFGLGLLALARRRR